MRSILLITLLALGCGASPALPGFGASDIPGADSGGEPDTPAPPEDLEEPDAHGGEPDPGEPLTDPGPDGEDPAEVVQEVADGAEIVEPPAGPCTSTGDEVSCEHETTVLMSGIGGLEPREVHWQVPAGAPPAEGWPVVLLFQGSGFSAQLMWSSPKTELYGAWHLGMTVYSLLQAGFAVVTPEVHGDGSTFWDTNVAPYNVAWSTAPDHQLMLDLLAGITTGDFGPLNADRLYAAGISSGGYMTSRFALTYPGVRAIAVHSASYATCAGSLCYVPSLPEDHAPTLFLHGTLDTVVPQWTMELYRNELQDTGIEVKTVLDPDAGHEWLEAGPSEIVTWFEDHP